ncbi:MAG: ribonuclease III domain-containing protein, partial [Pseudomonadota bacterium]
MSRPPSRDLARHAAALSDALGVPVAPTPRLAEALTHPSASTRARADNQRLEFLGDRILGLVIAEALFERYPDAAEGDLAPRYNA